MDKYIEQLAAVANDFLHLVKSFVVDNGSPKVEPVHILRALLHKSLGLVDYIENTLDSDYYYILDWTDVRMGQAPRSAYPMKDVVLSNEAKSVVNEAISMSRKMGRDEIDEKTLLAAVVTPGVGFSVEQLKTLPLSHVNIENTLTGSMSGPSNAQAKTSHAALNSGNEVYNYITELSGEDIEHVVIGFDEKISAIIESLSRKDRADIITKKLYLFNPDTQLFEAFLYGDNESEKKRHLALNGDYEKNFLNLPNDTVEINAKYGNNQLALLQFNKELQPVRFVFDGLTLLGWLKKLMHR